MLSYATSTDHWPEWQQAYRYGAFYIFPPAGVIEAIDALRQAYDPVSAAICQAHISLSEPLPRPLTPAHLEELRDTLGGQAAFDVHYGPLRSFPPHPGVVYVITPEAPWRRLRALLHATTPFAGLPAGRPEIAPHMTIAEFISLEETERLLHALQGSVPEGSFRCAAIEYAVPDDDFVFRRWLRLPLGP